jgi:hypothetical protein
VYAIQHLRKESVMATPKEQVSLVPADDEWFELMVDHRTSPIQLVIDAGYDKKDWYYLGPNFARKRVTYRVKLVHLGWVQTVEEAEKRAIYHRLQLVEGQARLSFMQRYPNPDKRGVIVFGGSQWQHPSGRANIAILGVSKEGKWKPAFRWKKQGFDEVCRWLVIEHEVTRNG